MKILKKTKTTWRIAKANGDATETGVLYSIEVNDVNYKIGVVRFKPGCYKVTEYTTGRGVGTFQRKTEPMGVALQRWCDTYLSQRPLEVLEQIAKHPKLNGT